MQGCASSFKITILPNSSDILTLALFPLPKLVFFPETTLPLHVFEPRYQALINDTLQNQGLIGAPQLKPGFEAKYLGEPEIYPVFGYGSLLWSEKTADGKFNILLDGVGRARLVSETLSPGGYRVAKAQKLFEVIDLSKSEQESWLHRVREHYMPLLPIYPKLSETLRKNLSELDDANQFCNIVGMNFIADENQRQALLECDSLKARTQLLEKAIAGESLAMKPEKIKLN